jgi:ferredoxin-thioredoxin reductase catalytic subunit
MAIKHKDGSVIGEYEQCHCALYVAEEFNQSVAVAA